MLTTTSNYDTENAKSARAFCAIVQFNGVADPQYCSATFSGIDSTYHQLVKDIIYESAGWEPGRKFLSRATLKFTLTDDSSDTVLSMINSQVLVNDTVTVKFGYTNLAEADFVILPTFYVKKIELADNLIDHTFVCEEYDIFNKIFDEPIITNQPTTFLTADETNASTTIDVNSTTGFIDATSLPSGIKAAGIRIGNEIMTYTGSTANTFTGASRGYGFTTAQNHSSGAEVKQVYIFGTIASPSDEEIDNFAQVILRILTNKDGTNSVYDSNITNFGYAIDETKIDVDQIEREGYHWHAAHHDYNSGGFEEFEFFVIGDEKGDKIIEDLLEPHHAVLYVGDDGKLKCKVLDAIYMINEDILNETLNDDNCKLIGHEWYDKGLKTKFRYRYGWNPLENSYDYESTNTNTPAETAYNTARQRYFLNNKGLIYTNSNDKFHTLDRFAVFYGQMPIKLTIKALPSKWLYEPLDVIKYTSNFMPNYTTGNRTTTDTECMVMKKIIQLTNNVFDVNYELYAFNLISKNSDDYTLYEYTPTDGTLSYSADKTATVEAADANRTFGTAVAFSSPCYAKLNITVGTGSDTEQWIETALSYVDSTPSFISYNTTRIRYNSSDNETFSVWIPLVSGYESGTTSLKYIKIDWFDRSTTTAGDLPSIEVDKILRYRPDYRIP